jgi:hypothetical protein
MKYKILTFICVILALAGALGSYFVLTSPEKTRVNIISDGKLVRTIDLSNHSDEQFDIRYRGRTNTIEVKDGKIRVKEADCRDHTCVKTGWLLSSAMPIVCLPNHLVIEFAGEEGGVDALAW